VQGQFDQQRLLARLTELFGVVALLLASVGLYGVTSYTVARRTAEIGVRMALGADRASVVRMVLRGALVQAGLGLLIGVPVALFAGHLVQAQLYGLRGSDPVVLLLAAVALGAAALVAGWIPASRAASVDPMRAMRAE
jgi:macrolide transport system ATP-binding/permease protein